MKSQKNVRLISLLLALALATSTLMTQASASYQSSWKNWSQGGSELRYASTRNDGTYAFRKYGCHFMAQCKLMAESGVVDAAFNPDDYFEWIISCGTKYIYGKQSNGTYAIGEKSIGASMIDYAKTRGVTISRVATVSLTGKTASQKKTLIQQYINQGNYVILDCAAHETYVMQGESKAKGTPWISDSGSRYSSVSTSSGIYAYTGAYGGGGGWEAAFTKAYVYSIASSGEAETTCTNHVKGKYLWYNQVHPHYDYYSCAVCGVTFRDTTTNNLPSCKICNPDPKPCNHVRGKYLWYAAEHPHYDHYICALCGEKFRDTTTNIMPTCEICCPINAYGIRLSGLSATNITANSVKLNASCAYTGSRPTSVGVFLGTGPNSLEIKGSDGGINHNKNPFSIWYNLSGLKAGTTYYYRFYAVVDGKMSYSEIKSFTTSAR